MTEADHHGRASLRLGGKVLATLWDAEHLNIMVDAPGIRSAVQAHPATCEPVRWGKRLNAVRVRLPDADPELVRALLTDAWERRAPARLRHA